MTVAAGRFAALFGSALPIADGRGTPIDVGADTALLIAALLFGWLAYARLRGKSFRSLPVALGWVSGALAVAALVLAFVLPPIIRPTPAATRPTSTARLRILSPAEDQAFRGSPARVEVLLALTGARIVTFTSTRLVPDEGHIHLYVDGALASMTYGLSQTLEIAPGDHRLLAEFVAVDHAPFHPRVTAMVTFRVEP
jgi:hypothetical protein